MTVFYRRTRGEMPAYAEEIEAGPGRRHQARDPGGSRGASSPQNGKLTGIEFQRNELGERDDSGRARPVPVPGSEFVAELDTLIVAISEEPETETLERPQDQPLGLPGRSTRNPTSPAKPGVFGGGDVVTGPSTVIEAIAAGKNAAIMIDRYMAGKQLKMLPQGRCCPRSTSRPVSAEDEGEAVGRIHPDHLPVEARVKNFAEVDLCPSENHALCEARRCLRCDIEFTQPVMN